MAQSFNRRLSRLVVAARATLAVERLWPALAPMIGVVLLFVASALMGFWDGIPTGGKIAGLALFLALFVLSGWRFLHVTLPDRSAALRRLESEASLDHRPLAAYEDTLAPGADAFAERLWQVHRARSEERLGQLKVPLPDASLVRSDPFALRSAVGLALFVGVVVGAGALAERLVTPFTFTEPAEAAVGPQFRLDAWVTPPAYTGRSPLFLSAATHVATADGISVPAGSVLTVRSQGVESVELTLSKDGVSEAQALSPLAGEAAQARALEGTVTIDAALAVEVRRGGEVVAGWRFTAEPDRAPTAKFSEAPRSTQRDQFELRYELDDDYAIASAEATVRPLGAVAGRRPLVEDPKFPVTLPGGAGLRGLARTVHDLTAHPFAGREVELTIAAVDGKGQTGVSRPETFRLPARLFLNKVAKAVIEQRGKLAMDADAQLRVIDAIDLMLLDGDAIGSAGGYLALDAAYNELAAADTDDELRAVLETLWEVALVLEDDGLSDAERALQAAQERLRQALEDGADEEEVQRLTRELREAMQEFMRALARQAEQNPDQQAQNDPNAKTITQKDLDEMLKRIEELSRQGRNEEAEALLAEMQQMMQNLQMAQQQGRGQQGQQGQGGQQQSQEGQTLEELGRMIQRQQELMDETHRQNPGQGQQQGRQGQGQQGRGQQGEGQQGQGQGQQGQGQPGGEGSEPGSGQGSGSLAERQRQLQDDLAAMMRRLEERGFAPGERMGDAQRSMGDAGEALGGGRTGEAVTDQADALAALREGAQQMAQQLAEARGEEEGDQQGGNDGQYGPGQDPLGRARREGTYADTSRVGVPDEIDTQRAREILQELRRRLGEFSLPRLERDYLERLVP